VEKCCDAAGSASNPEKILLGRSVEEDGCICCGCDAGKGNPEKLPTGRG
jgi:hypothetical protein